MQNIEIKAKYPELHKARDIAKQIGAIFEGRQVQIDTYFAVEHGRLKLRESSRYGDQLIFYRRPDRTAPKMSNYTIFPISAAGDLKDMLRAALGIRQIVEKERDVFLYDEVRIHLDNVKNLGSFIEFEGVLASPDDASGTQTKVEWLMQQFRITPSDLLAHSYSDLLPGSEQH